MKKRTILILMILCIAALTVLICGIVMTRTEHKNQQNDVEELRDQLKVYHTITETEATTEDVQIVPETEETQEETIAEEESIVHEETEPEPIESETEPAETEPERESEALLDFKSMWEVNSDICAWIEIEGTKVDYPVLQSPEDDSKYLTTAVDGSYYVGGSLFTQSSYNSSSFDDPVTVIYGHTMRSGTLFGQLQPTFSSSSGFAEHSEIKLSLPDDVRYYTVFAAVPYENIHILHTYDFSNDYWYKNFFKGVAKIRSFGAQFNRDITPEPGDRVIILSTCLNEDSTKRFLVMAILQEDIE